MPRKPAADRKLATNRVPAVGRKLVGFVDDGKIHAVLDTNVPIYAIWALSKGNAATQTERDCLTIVKAIENGRITIGVNAALYKEYQDKAQHHLTTGKIKHQDVSYVLKIVNDNYVSSRMLVDPQRTSRDSDDDMLFDGLAADYLVSENLKDVKPERLLPGIKSPYAATLAPTDFVALLSSLRI